MRVWSGALLLLVAVEASAEEIDRFWERNRNFSRSVYSVDVAPIAGFRPFPVKQAYGPSKLRVKAVGNCPISHGTTYVGLQTDAGELVVPPHYSELVVVSDTVVYGARLCPLPGDPEWTRRYDRIELPAGTITPSGADRIATLPLGDDLSGIVPQEFVQADTTYIATLLHRDGTVAFRVAEVQPAKQPDNFDHLSIPDTAMVERVAGGLVVAHHGIDIGASAKRWDVLYDINGRRVSPDLPPLVRLPGGAPGARIHAVPVSADGLVWPLDAAGGLVPLGDGVVGVRPLIRRVPDVARGTKAHKPRQMLMSGGVVANIESDRPPPAVPRWTVKEEDAVVGWLARKDGPDGARWTYVADLSWLQAGLAEADLATFSEVVVLDDLVRSWGVDAVMGWEGLDPTFLAREPGGDLAWLRLRGDGVLVPEVARTFPDRAAADAWIARYAADRRAIAAVESTLATARKEADPVWQAQKQEHAAKVAAAMEAKRLYELEQQVMKCVTGAPCSTEYMGDLVRLAPPTTYDYDKLVAQHRERLERTRIATEEAAQKAALEAAQWVDSGGCVLCLPDNPLAAQRDQAWQNYMSGSQGWYIDERNNYVNPSR